MSALIGEWKCVSCDNLDAVMIEVGAHLETSDHFRDRMLTVDIEGNEVYIRDRIGDRKVGTTFVFGREIQEMTPDGRIVQSVVTLDSEREMTQIQRHGFNETRIIRTVFGNKMIMKMKAGDSVAVLKYIRTGVPIDTKQYFTPPEPEPETEEVAGAAVEPEPVAQTVVN